MRAAPPWDQPPLRNQYIAAMSRITGLSARWLNLEAIVNRRYRRRGRQVQRRARRL